MKSIDLWHMNIFQKYIPKFESKIPMHMLDIDELYYNIHILMGWEGVFGEERK